MTAFFNRAISASAGTGKTFRLAHRYIGLMAAGVPPDRICALTFSRKAAGEIFDTIVRRLCLAAMDDGERAQTAAMVGREGHGAPPDDPVAYVRLLRQLLDHEHRLRVGTLDSFILGVVRAFPMELGIAPDSRPVDGEGGEALSMRQSILMRLFDPMRRGQPGAPNAGAFLLAFRQANPGRESKALAATLDKLVETHFGNYRKHSAAAWGDDAVIWPGKSGWWMGAGLGTCGPLASDWMDRLAKEFGADKNSVKLAGICADVVAAAGAHALDMPWPKFNETVFPQLLAACVAGGPTATIKYSRTKGTIPSDLWADVRQAIGHAIAVEVHRALSRTQGLKGLLSRYHDLYTEALSQDGGYTFEDLACLLGADGLSPGRTPDVAGRLYIDYRLDGRLDHWLLDEFQDTSDTQWAALANLIDECVQDDSRSFFYVGDVKQSVYGWRGGNHRLFGQVLRHYGAPGPRAIVAESMAECHRSLPAVITAINGVFDHLPAWLLSQAAAPGLRPDAVKAFAEVWQTHVSARVGEGEGYAALLEYAASGPGGGDGEVGGEGEGDADGDGDPVQYRAVAEVLKRTHPTGSGLSVAVLVRNNAHGRQCVNVLRRQLPGVPVVHEGKGGIVDNPVVTLLLALVRYAAHPGDTVALRHLQMSPLAACSELRDVVGLPRGIVAAIHTRGFADTLRGWSVRFEEDLDPFGRQRLREFLAAAEAFDATGSRDADAFADHVAAYQVSTMAAAGTVRVMTIHQAKGLGFDLVVVPFAKNGRSFENPGEHELLQDEEWVLASPRREVMKGLTGAPVAALEQALSNDNFSQLCVLYVALTRAQKALYMLIPEPAKTSSVWREADLLRARLATGAVDGVSSEGLRPLFVVGDENWHRQPRKGGPPLSAPDAVVTPVGFAAAIARREPSKEQAEGRAFPAEWLFRPEAGDVRAFGSAIHRLFEKVEWFEAADADRIVAEWRREAAGAATFLDDVERQFRACLANAGVRRRLARPVGAVQVEVWREAPFDLVLESGGVRQLMSGRFDRLVIERDAAGCALRATVFDFKSNRAESEAALREAAEGYAFQMADYARAAARLLALPVAQVDTVLLFTRSSWMWPEEG